MIEFSGALYHITSRGNGKRDIFLDNRDRESFLELLSIKAYKQFVSEGYGAEFPHDDERDWRFPGDALFKCSSVSRAVKKYESTKKNEKQKKKNVALQDATPNVPNVYCYKYLGGEFMAAISY